MKHAIVLAAGEGTKAWPYGEYRQKCTVPVANVPIVRRLVQNLIGIGCEHIHVVVGHHAQQVKGAVADLKGVRFVRQTHFDGTATAALMAAEGIDEPFLVVYGDIVTTTENLRQFAYDFGQSDAEAGALVQPLGHEDGSNWICAGISGNQIQGIEGHPRGGSHRLCGVYAFEPSAKSYLLRNPGVVTRVPVGGMPPVEAEVAQSIQIMIDDGRTVFGAQTSGFLVDVDKPWHILEANHRLIEHMAQQLDGDVIADGATVSDGAEINGRLILGRNTHIGPRVVVNGTLVAGAHNNITNGAILKGKFAVGSHCRISDYCYVGGNTSIGNHCIVGHGAEMSGILMDKVYLYHYCEMSGVFGCATDIGGATVCGTLRFDDRDTPHNIKGRYEVPPVGADASYIGDYCRTGVNAILMPGCKVGSYSVVGPGVIVYEDIPSKTMVLAKQELVQKSWGPERYGW